MNRILLLALVVAGLFFSSCIRLTDEQAAQLAQGKADVGAARLTSDISTRNALYAAAGARLMAGVYDIDLPAPGTPVSALVATDSTPITPAVEKEVQESHAAETAPPTGVSAGVLGMIGAGGLAVLGLLRFVPGAGGVVADLAYNFIAPKVSRETDRKAHELFQHGAAVVQYGVEMAHVAEAVAPEAAESVQRRMLGLQQTLGIQGTVADLVTAAKARAAASRTSTPQAPEPPASPVQQPPVHGAV